MESALVSYAQNGEDIVLWRALGHEVSEGRYVDVGANDPTVDSVTRLFYERGWSGINVEPVAVNAAALREQRARDVTVEAAATDEPGPVVLHEVQGTGLSTLLADIASSHKNGEHKIVEREVPTVRLDDLLEDTGWEEGSIHFLKVDVEGAEAAVLRSIDLTRWRPWVLVVEATKPNTSEVAYEEWEPGVLEAGYQRALFDGVSQFYLHADHARLAPKLSYPACALDHFTRRDYEERNAELDQVRHQHHLVTLECQALRREETRLLREHDEIVGELVRTRGPVLRRWVTPPPPVPDTQLRAEIQARDELIDTIHRTLSWRITKPLRSMRGLTRRDR